MFELEVNASLGSLTSRSNNATQTGSIDYQPCNENESKLSNVLTI